MKKILTDTMTAPNGKWSMKRITAFVVMMFILLLGTFIVVSDKILKTEINQYGIQVFNSLLLFEATLLGLAEASKKILNKEKTDEQSTGTSE